MSRISEKKRNNDENIVTNPFEIIMKEKNSGSSKFHSFHTAAVI